MSEGIDIHEVARHASAESCWVILYGHVYDVTDFLSSHPGGANVILRLAGRDATEDFDPIHPAGTLEEGLRPEAKLGPIKLARVIAEYSRDKANTQEIGRAVFLPALLNADDIEEAASKLLSKKAWAYYSSAGDDLITKTYNNTVYRSIFLRPRVMVDCTSCDTSTYILDQKVSTPLFVAPAAQARLAHKDGERGIAKAISSFGAVQIVSNSASLRPEDIIQGAAPGQVFGWQLYVQESREKSESMLARISNLQEWYKFIVLTVDTPIAGKRELDERMQFEDAFPVPLQTSGSVTKKLGAGLATNLSWRTTLPWLALHTKLPIVLKGVQTYEDALEAMKYAGKGRGQIQAILLSNHGGRSLDTASPAIHTLLEIRKYCPQVFTKMQVWIDGGIKRGTDVVKAVCLGATAVGIGRLPLYGLAVGGSQGVHRVFEILQDEIERCMRLLGAKTIEELGPRFVSDAASLLHLAMDVFTFAKDFTEGSAI